MEVVCSVVDPVLEKEPVLEEENESPVLELTYPEGGTKAWLCVFGGFIGLLCAFGLINTMGAIESYVATHILPETSQVALSMVFSVFVFLIMSVMMISGVIFDIYGYKMICCVGTVLTCGGIFATGSCTELYQFFLAFSLCAGVGVGLLTTPLITASGHYFEKRRGLAMSLLMPGASLGGVVWPLLCRSLFDKVGFAWTMRTLGFIFLFILIISTLAMSDRHKEIQRVRYQGGQRPPLKFTEFVDINVLKDITFLWVGVAICTIEFSIILVTTYVPSYALSKGFSESESLLALTVLNASGVVGRILPLVLSDHYGPFNMGVILCVMMTVCIFVIWLPFGHYMGGLMAFSVLFGFAMAGTLAITPLCTSAISEPSEFGKRYGTAYFFVSFINLIALPVGMALTTTKMGYNAMVVFTGATTVLALVAFVVCRYRVGGGLRLKLKC